MLRVNTALLETVRKFRKPFSDMLRKVGACTDFGAEQFRIGGKPPGNLQGWQGAIRSWRGAKQIGERKAVDQRSCACEVGVNLESFLVTRYQ